MPTPPVPRRPAHTGPARLAVVLVAACLLHGVAPQSADAAQEGPLVTVETTGEEAVGRLVSIDPTEGVRLSDETFAQLPPSEVLTIRFTTPHSENEALAGEVTLTDGSRFGYQRVRFEDDRLVFTLRNGARVETPVASLSVWRLGVPPTDGNSDDETIPTGGAADVLLVKRRDGEFTPVEGVVDAVTEAGVRFVLDTDGAADPVDAPWPRVGGLRFYREASPKSEPAAALIELADGARFAAAVATFDGRLAWRSQAGGAGEAPAEAVASIDLSAGRVTRVAALQRRHSEWRSYFGETDGEAGRVFDAAFSGRPLSLRFADRRAPKGWPAVSVTRRFEHGLALRSQGGLRFALPAGATRLRGWIGLDPATARAGSADVAVLADEQTLWSGRVDGATRPVALDEPLTGAKTLTLRVEYGANLDSGDNVHFADLRVIQ